MFLLKVLCFIFGVPYFVVVFNFLLNVDHNFRRSHSFAFVHELLLLSFLGRFARLFLTLLLLGLFFLSFHLGSSCLLIFRRKRHHHLLALIKLLWLVGNLTEIGLFHKVEDPFSAFTQHFLLDVGALVDFDQKLLLHKRALVLLFILLLDQLLLEPLLLVNLEGGLGFLLVNVHTQEVELLVAHIVDMLASLETDLKQYPR